MPDLNGVPLMDVIAVLVGKLADESGVVTLEQDDFTKVSGKVLLNGMNQKGLNLKLVSRMEFETMRDQMPPIQ